MQAKRPAFDNINISLKDDEIDQLLWILREYINDETNPGEMRSFARKLELLIPWRVD